MGACGGVGRGGALDGFAEERDRLRAFDAQSGVADDERGCRFDAGLHRVLPIAFHGELFEYQEETFDALVTKVGHGITGHVAETGQSHYSPDAEKDPHAILIPGTADVPESILAVPLTYAGRVLGVIVLSKLGIEQFDHEDMRLLEVLASHAAVAIENARLLHLERESALRARSSEARQTAILRSALDCVIAIDHEGRIVEFNPAGGIFVSELSALGSEPWPLTQNQVIISASTKSTRWCS